MRIDEFTGDWDQAVKYFLTEEQVYRCRGKRIAIDTETTGLFWYCNELIGISLSCPDANVHGFVLVTNDNSVYVKREMLKILDSPETTLIFHNAKFDLHFLGWNPRNLRSKIFDTSVMIHLYDSRLKKSLEKVEEVVLGEASKRKIIASLPARTPVWRYPIQTLVARAINDAIVTYQLAETLIPRLRELALLPILQKEMEYMKVIWNAERRGILIDDDFCERAIGKLSITLEKLEQELFDATGKIFNWRSPQQLSIAIYDGLGIPKPKNPFADADGVDRSRFADKGLYKSTCTSTFLLTEKAKHPLGPLISAVREAARMIKTAQKYQELADENRVVHQNYNQTGTRTGRLSCSKPNMQNVPSQVRGRFTQSVYSGEFIREEEYNLRNCFIARPRCELLSVDWKQMEMRMFGILAQDMFMLKVLTEGLDVHAEIAQRVWGTSDKVHREWSKTIGFGLIYGMTIGSLMHKLSMTSVEAARIRDQYLSEFPRIMPWMNEVIEECGQNGFIRYWNNRIWRESYYKDYFKGANAKIQGGCAEILSIAVIRVGDFFQSYPEYDSHIVNFVHDELKSEVPKEYVEKIAKEKMRIMEVPDLLDLPFYNSAKSGDSYGAQEKLFKTAVQEHEKMFIDLFAKDIEDNTEESEDMDLELIEE